MSETLSYQLSQKLDTRGYNGQLALGYLDAINDLMNIEERLFKPHEPTISTRIKLTTGFLT